MLNLEKQLLCTFVCSDDYLENVSRIRIFYNIPHNKIFIFCNSKNKNEYYITYTVYTRSNNRFPNTILIHRKHEYNTLYTLNAMNRLISIDNAGVFDKSFQLDWQLYSNSMILTNDVNVNIIPLTLIDIIS